MSDIHSGVGDVRCEMCAADDVLTMRWSQYVTLCDKHRNATSIATAVHSALHSAEREVLEAGLALLAKHDNPEVRAGLDSAFQLAWVHGIRYTGPTWEAELERMRTAASRYRALLDKAKAEGNE